MFLNKPKAKPFLLVCMIGVAFASNAQNINNPNKLGPLGTQVNTFSGNVLIPRTDMVIPARGFDINISFYYNSFHFDSNTEYGNGWGFEYDIRYKHDTANGRAIIWGDGREDNYTALSGGGYKAPRGFFSTLTQYQSDKYLLKETDGTKYFFDNSTHKRITKMEEPNGNFITFIYTDTLLTGLVTKAGQSIFFTYSNGRLETVTDAIVSPSRTYTYVYDGNGNLTEVTDPLNGKYRYTYLVNGPMKTLSDKNNNVVDIIYFPDFTASELIGCNKRVSFSYDTTSSTTVVTEHLTAGNNQVTKYTYERLDNLVWLTSISGNCCGFNMTYEFDNQGNKIKETDANGNAYEYTYDARGNILTMKNPLNQISRYTYSSDFNKVTSYTDSKGALYTLTYDAAGNVTSITEPGNISFTATYNANGDIVNSTDPKGNTYTYNYDAYGNPETATGPNGYKATLSFNARGNLLSYADAVGNSHNVEYDILSRLKKITDANNNSLQANYDAQGNAISFINKNGETTLLNYDASNRLVNVKNPLGQTTQLTYDGMDNLVEAKNEMGNTSKLLYDSRNRLTAFHDPLNNKAALSYDANGNIISVIHPSGQSTNYTYDKLNRLTNASDLTGTVATFTYDENNNITSSTNSTGATISATYDSSNRTQKITDAIGNTTSFTYDNNDNVTSITDRNGFTTSYTYDGKNRAKIYTDKNGFVIEVSYDSRGNMTEAKDQNNNLTTYTYDNLNRLITTTYPDGKFIQLSYDKKDNVTSKKLTDGTTITFQYDALNRMTTKTLPDGQLLTFTYDALGNITSATNKNGTIILTYDPLNRITSETFGGKMIRYEYNIAGRTQTTIYPDNTVITKNFDTRNRLTGITKNNTNLVSYKYNNANQLTEKLFANGVNTNMQYDFANRLSSITTANGAIQNTTFTYDKERNKTAINRLNNPSQSEQFTYDNGYRLTSYKKGSVLNTYSYDAVGNRKSANLNGASTTYTINNLNQITSVNNTNLTYDSRGNLMYDGKFYKTYDVENRIVKDSSSPISVVSYSYDAFGRRISKTINGISYHYTYSGAAQIEERNSSNALLNRTVFTNFLSPVLNEKDGNAYYYHQNELNSVEAITNSNGALSESYRYDVYGKLTRYDGSNNVLASSITGNRFGFTGQEWDSTTNNYNFFFRNYSAELGTFNQRDPIGYDDGMGMYQYVGNNPANGVDVWGLEESFPCANLTEVNKIRIIPRNLIVSEQDKVVKEAYQGFKKVPVLGHLAAGVMADSKFYRDVKNNDGAVGGVDFYFDGQVMKNYDVNYYFTSYANASRGWSAMDVDAQITAWNVGKGTAQTLWNDDVAPLTQKWNETALKLDIGRKGFNDYDAGTRIENIVMKDIPVEYQYKQTGYGEWWPVFNPKTGEVTYEFFINKNLVGDEHQLKKVRKYLKDNCPPKGGTRKPRPKTNPKSGKMLLVAPLDPNEIHGPEGESAKKWVSVKDRMPYTILFENDSTATAPAKFIRITSAIEPKQDANSFQLGSFGFNNQTFDIPANTASYYNRLDCRDSLGLYVDVTAGYDQINNLAFWELQAIDPATLLPTQEPLAGLLLLQDTANPQYGNGFVNFSIKPKQSAITGDTIAAKAQIIFDQNEMIPTNIHTNTIDAFAPTSHLNITPPASNSNVATLSWSGADDTNGSGIRFYTLYVSTDSINYNILNEKITRTDTSFTGASSTKYYFFVLATDSVGNAETLRTGEVRSVFIEGAFPFTSLPSDHFRSVNTGVWSSISTWQSSHDSVSFYAATLSPDSNSRSILVQNGHTISVTSNVTIDQAVVNPLGTLVITGNTLTVANNGLTLKSNASGSARIGNSTGTVLGNVTVERFIPANASRQWRLLSIPTITTQTINASWQNGMAPGITGVGGIGTMISSNNGNASFDFRTPGNSMLNYNQATNAWNGMASTNSPIATDNGYMLFTRGDRTATPLNNIITTTILSTTGSLKQGNYPAAPISVPASKFGLIGNPYASQIDFRNVTKDAGIDNTFYVWDPKPTGSYGLGAYQTLTLNGGNYIITPGGGSYGSTGSIMNTIESGQAFLVHSTSTGNISFTENAKSTGNNMVFRTDTDVPKSWITNLYSAEAAGDNLTDGTLILFDNTYSSDVDNKDALKLTNFGVNLGMVKAGKTLSVEKRPSLSASDTIYFNLDNTKAQQYRFEFTTNGLQYPGLSAWLVDRYLNTSTAVDLNGLTTVNFSVTTDIGSSAANRFIVVFAKPYSFPVNAKPYIVVYPNPVQNGLLKVQLNNMPKGNYSARLVNSLGQTVLNKEISHPGGTFTETLTVNKIAGAYMLEVIQPDKNKFIKKVIIN